MLKMGFLKYLLILVLLFPIVLRAQSCAGNFGDPVVNITFGSGSTPGPIASTNYNYTTASCPIDGSYTIVNRTNGCFGNNWHTLSEDHTPGDSDGFMMLVNASNAPGEFYKETITDLCPGTTYEFSAYVVNVLKPSASGTKPNLTFIIESVSGSVLGSYSTGNIPESLNPEWKKYALVFTTPVGVSSVVLKILNTAPGGNGNDLALDDITFRACGPTIKPKLNGSLSPFNVCEGISQTVTLNADLGPGYTNPAFIWQKNIGNSGWLDIPGANTKESTIVINPSSSISHQYRLATAESFNIGSPGCRIISDIITLSYFDKPIADAGPDKITIQDKPIALTASATGHMISYKWSPATFLDDPYILNPISTPDQDITYTLEITDACNSVSTDQVFIKVLKNITIPNAFSPNGDGVNDLWNVAGLDSYPNADVLIFNRYGAIIYQSKGYQEPWDGTYRGTPIPRGTYYYSINLNNGSKLYSGSVFLMD
jgi:gliding motility-associated-like protein